MAIQKKSLINKLNTTKKALVASTPTGSVQAGTTKPRVGKPRLLGPKPRLLGPKPTVFNPTKIY